MKKLIFKTALITFGVTLILAVSVFGIVSFCAPSAMMRFFDSIGLENISGDYAYQEWQKSKDMSYLARAFEIAADNENDTIAMERFTELYGEDGSDRRIEFSEFCLEQTGKDLPASLPEEIAQSSYRTYVCARAACVKYRLAKTEEERSDVADFAIRETESDLTVSCPVTALALEALDASDDSFCELLRQKLIREVKFNKTNQHYINILKFLEDASNE